jgi:hypothetical protein
MAMTIQYYKGNRTWPSWDIFWEKWLRGRKAKEDTVTGWNQRPEDGYS